MASGIDGFNSRLQQMSQVMTRLPELLAPLAVTCVQTNMDGPFTANAALTTSLKNKGAKPLFETGETRASITYRTESGAFTVGSPLPHAPLINNGGTLVPKKAKSLLVPSTRGLKRKAKAMGIRGLLSSLEDSGWRIVWRPKAVLGVPPEGGSVQGLPLKPKQEEGEEEGEGKQKARRLCLLFYRLEKIDVPKREFMVLHEEQQALLLEEARRAMERAK